MRKRWSAVVGLAILVASLMGTSWAAAFSERFLSDNNIIYYDPNGGGEESGGSEVCINAELSSVARGLIGATSIPSLATQNKSAYETGAKAAGIPWQVLAAIHWREANMNASKSIANGQPLGAGVSVDGQAIGATLAEDAVIAANKALSIGKAVYSVDISSSNSIGDFARAFLAYNRGYMYKNHGTEYTESPYVMNGFDEAHRNMTWTTADVYNKPGGTRLNSLVIGSADGNKIGALAVFVYLMGGGVSGSDCSVGGLKSGGMNLTEARSFMAAYRQEASKKSTAQVVMFDGAQVGVSGFSAGCKDGTLNNCSAFSQWFVNRYTTAGTVSIFQGSTTVARLLALNKGFVSGGHTPKVYAVMSMGPQSGSAASDWTYNHTGIVLGIDEANDRIIIGEAACSGFRDIFPNANAYSLSKYTNTGSSSSTLPTYAYTDGILKGLE